MLSDKLPQNKSPNRQRVKGAWYSDTQKMEAVKLWMITGNMPATAAALNIPLVTVKSWRYSKWWDELVSELRSENTLKMSNKLKTIAEKALDITLDRLDNGDFFYDQKAGEIVRKPVNLRDASKVATDLLDRHVELDKKPYEEAAQQKAQDRLEQLASAFAQFAKKTTKIEVVDAIQIEGPSPVDVLPETQDGEEMGEGDEVNEDFTEEEINAIHEKRETRL